jgi:hypothetical protein
MKYSINLFPPPQETFVDKVVVFSFGYLRYIIVLTQMVVLGVFMFRFTVDQDIVDLKDTLQQKKAIIDVSAPLMNQAVHIDKKATNIKQILSAQDNFSNMISYYLSVFPEKVTSSKLTITNEGIETSGVAQEAGIIQDFYNRLVRDKHFNKVNIKDLRKVDNQYVFTLSLKEYIN